MSDPVDSNAPVSFSASSWYLWRRVVAMTVLPLAFSAYFFYDWKVGYPAEKIKYDASVLWKKENKGEQEWLRYAEEHGLDKEPDEMTDEKIQGQLHWGIGTGIVGLGLLAYYLLSYPKKLSANEVSFSPPWHPNIPFSSVKKLDRRPWKHKGLAYAYYDGGKGGKLKKASIDDLRFPGSEEILNRLQENFDGEILDLAEEPVDAADEPAEEKTT